ncbi:MAG TPA: HNH endonuclease [Chthoniobacteraceae bacterium]|jgi:5-methylcytosine-specific restriction endonuclease McrA|nr:HNH endonuclease [Chthoniobacteraceae bacterium]
MNEAVREQVRRRAGNTCEYCGAREGPGTRLRFHIEHIIAHQHGGDDDLENLALACHLCNAHKGPNLTGIDPETRKIVALFHPRRDRWEEHFANVAGRIIGQTSTGRATVAVLNMNHSARVELRLTS